MVCFDSGCGANVHFDIHVRLHVHIHVDKVEKTTAIESLRVQLPSTQMLLLLSLLLLLLFFFLDELPMEKFSTAATRMLIMILMMI